MVKFTFFFSLFHNHVAKAPHLKTIQVAISGTFARLLHLQIHEWNIYISRPITLIQETVRLHSDQIPHSDKTSQGYVAVVLERKSHLASIRERRDWVSHYDSDWEAAKKLNRSQLLFAAEVVFWGSQDTAKKNHCGKNTEASLKMNVESLIFAAAPDLVQMQPQGSHQASCCIPWRSTNVPSPQTSAGRHSHWPNCTRARLSPLHTSERNCCTGYIGRVHAACLCSCMSYCTVPRSRK